MVAVLALEEAEPARLRELVHLLENPERDNLVAINGLDEIVVLKPAQLSDGVWQSAQERSRIEQLLTRIPTFGCASGWVITSPGSKGWRSLPDGAGHLAPGCARRRAQVYFFEDYRLPVLLGSLADSWQADQLRALLRLAREDAKGYCRRRCASISCRDCDPHPCAEALFIHPKYPALPADPDRADNRLEFQQVRRQIPALSRPESRRLICSIEQKIGMKRKVWLSDQSIPGWDPHNGGHSAQQKVPVMIPVSALGASRCALHRHLPHSEEGAARLRHDRRCPGWRPDRQGRPDPDRRPDDRRRPGITTAVMRILAAGVLAGV